MSTVTKIILAAVFSFFLLLAGTALIVYFSAKFTSEGYEADLRAADKQMQTVNGTMHNKLEMNGFTVEKYGKDFIDAIIANAKRYEGDKGGLMKWVQETSTSLPPEVHLKFMNTVDAVYSDFEAAQNQKNSVAQEYEKFLNASFIGYAAKWQGYPTTSGAKIMERVISTSKTKEAWVDGTDDAKNPFQTK